MKITSIGHGQASDNEHVVFCVVNFTNVVVSSYYPDKQEYGMYWFENLVQEQINRGTSTITWFDLEWLDTMKCYSSITRIEKLHNSKTMHNPYGYFSQRNTINSYVRENHKIGRNELCTCDSGKKYKNCCGK